MTEKPLILVINPGSTSTKIALFQGTEMLKELDITHPGSELAGFSNNLEQLDYRAATVEKALCEWNCQETSLKAVIGRGGPLKPLGGGVYHVGESLMKDLNSGKLVDHASNLAGLNACRIAEK